MNYTLPVKDLKTFFSKSSYLSGTGYLPIYGFIRIVFQTDQAILTRCSSSSYYSQVVEVQNEPGELLIESYKLQALVNTTKSDAILFSVGDGITLNGKVKCTLTDAQFPVVPVVESTATELDEEMVTVLKTAVKFLNTKDTTPGRFNHVFIGGNHICASNNNMFYLHSMPTGFSAAVYPEMINALPGACSLTHNDTWCMFSTLTASYLFRRPEIGFFDMSSLAALPERVGSVSVDDFAAFLALASAESKSVSVVSSIACEGRSCTCHTPDSDYGVEVTEVIDYDGEPFAFTFNVEYMLQVVALMSGTITLHPKGDALYMTSGEGFVCIVMKMFNQN